MVFPARRGPIKLNEMKTTAIKKLHAKLAADQPVYGLWITLESASIAEMAVALGLDWVVIDAEHGHLDWKEIVEHVRATVRSDTVALVRIAELSIGLIKRALDIGADGVVVPWVESAEQLRQAVAFAHYPPEGVRGIGAERATGWGECFAEHAQEANEHVLVVPIIESVQGGRNVPSMLSVSGVDLFFFGRSDEWSWKAVENATTTYDFHATILHLLGIDHKKLSFRHSGIDRRLTDVHGRVVKEVLV